MAWDKNHTASISEYNITRKADSSADLSHRIKAGHNKIFNWGRIYATVVNLKSFDSFDLLQITDTAPYNSSAGLGSVFDSCGKISTYKSSLVDLVIHISYDYISFYQSINYPLVTGSFSSLRSTDFLYCLLKIRSCRHERTGHSSSNQFCLILMKPFQFFLKLIQVAFHKHRLPYLF